MDLTLVCQSFPRSPMAEIRRDNILDTIERTFTGDIEVVMIEGGEGLGKTTLLAQFVRRHANHTFSLFTKSTSSFGHDPASLRYDLCCQLLWVLRPDESCKPEETDEGYLRHRIFELRRRARRETYYFVIDGLGDIPDEGIRSTILDMLPFGEGFRFLLSGELYLLPRHVDRNACKSSQMVSFSLDETVKYFADLSLQHDLVEELYQACGRGVPGHLASVRRNIRAGRDPQTLVKDKLADLLEEEWKQVRNNELALQALAVIVYAQHQPTVEDLAHLLEQDTEQVRAMIASLTFLAVDGHTSKVAFVSDSFHKFATDKLRDRRESVLDLIIQDLLDRRDSEIAMHHLPWYLQQRGKLNEVLEWLCRTTSPAS